MNTIKRLSAARTALVLDQPFFGVLALRLQFVEAPHITNTAATDGRSLFYSADYIATLSDAEIVALIAHEIMHLACLHHARRGARDPKRWNEAADYALNPLLADSGFHLGQGWLNDASYAGLSAEQIYERLPTPPPENDGQGDNSGGSGDGSGNALADMPGAVLDAPEPSDAADWQVAVKQAAQVAKMMGRLPDAMSRAIKEAMRPRLDWRALLRRFVQQCATADYSWRMPNRRYIAGGLYLPELRSETLPPIVVAIDTSGSIGEQELAEFSAEVSSIIDECAPESTHVIYCDAKVQRVDTFARGEPIEMHAAGGGGTDFRPVFDHVDAEQIAPACLIYLTDGEGSYPKTPSDYPTLWAITSDKVAPWGESVRIEQ